MQSFRSLTRLAAPLITRSLLTPTLSTPSFSLLRPTNQFNVIRSYSAEAGLTKESIQARILEVLTSFEKVDPVKVTPTASFTTELGLDSLDAVEVVMAIEEEFSIEIPDEEADRITTVGEAIDYISKSPEAH